MYVNGPPSVGKQMLGLGLSRIWSRESVYVPYEEMTGDFNSTLKKSPLIWADEKVPQDAFRANDSSLFRRLVGNTGFSVNEKYRVPATMLGYTRVLITANNADALAIREELDRYDIEAIQTRLGYVECDEKPRAVLEKLAGGGSTREYTDDWVAGGKLAEHVLWLEQNRDVTPGNRFLVPGWESDLTRGLPTRVGSASSICSVLATAIVADVDTDAVRWFEGKVYSNTNLLRKNWTRIMGHAQDNVPSETAVTKALRSMSQGESRRLSRRMGDGRVRYWELDAELVGEVARRRNICDSGDIVAAAGRDSEPETPVHQFTEKNT
jgi:hypothetical protein